MPDHPGFSLRGETALITGGGTGLGYGIAEAFLAAGAEVIVTGRRQRVLEEAVQTLGPGARAIVNDITDPAAADTLMTEIQDMRLRVTILVNNAGRHLKKPAVETNAEEFRAVLETHVNGAFDLTRAVLPGMLERRHGSILFLASMTSFLGIPQVIAYSAAKSAYLGMIRCLASEVGSQGVRVNGIAPGWIETPMLQQALQGDKAREQKILARTPLGRFGSPSDIGFAAVYLCSPAAQFVNGVILPVDGGASIGF